MYYTPFLSYPLPKTLTVLATITDVPNTTILAICYMIHFSMAERLTNAFQRQLEEWIGSGPKTFTLLYSISKDGCNNTTFHQKCDNKGPTVTILYNAQGSVYGGYTSVPWNTGRNGNYDVDASAFMFRLQYNGTKATCKFPCINPANAIYQNTNYGPIFGGGHDLCTFNGTINKSGDTFALNGSFGINKGFSSQGVPANEINNGTMAVVELEVYQVTGMLCFRLSFY